jgi:lipopolysaccharide biosynthesis regulator YciM
VRFAQAQLAAFPTGEWSTGEEAPVLETTRPLFERALALDRRNVTAHYRLGLLAGLERDFDRAAAHLAAAYAADAGHRGVQKALAYTYVWLGQLERAQPLLAALPEARRELEAYAWWWRLQGREDLAERAVAARSADG